MPAFVKNQRGVKNWKEAGAWLEWRGIEDIECITPDQAGVARGKMMPAEKFFAGPVMTMPTSIFTQTISGDYPPEDEMAVRAFDDEAIGSKLRRAPRPDREGDVGAGLDQPPTEVAADAAGAEDQDAHQESPCASILVAAAPLLGLQAVFRISALPVAAARCSGRPAAPPRRQARGLRGPRIAPDAPSSVRA